MTVIKCPVCQSNLEDASMNFCSKCGFDAPGAMFFYNKKVFDSWNQRVNATIKSRTSEPTKAPATNIAPNTSPLSAVSNVPTQPASVTSNVASNNADSISVPPTATTKTTQPNPNQIANKSSNKISNQYQEEAISSTVPTHPAGYKTTKVGNNSAVDMTTKNSKKSKKQKKPMSKGKNALLTIFIVFAFLIAMALILAYTGFFNWIDDMNREKRKQEAMQTLNPAYAEYVGDAEILYPYAEELYKEGYAFGKLDTSPIGMGSSEITKGFTATGMENGEDANYYSTYYYYVVNPYSYLYEPQDYVDYLIRDKDYVIVENGDHPYYVYYNEDKTQMVSARVVDDKIFSFCFSDIVYK